MKNKFCITLIFNLLAVGLFTQEKYFVDTENILTKKEKIAIESAMQYQSDFYNRLFSEKSVNHSGIKFVIANNLTEYVSLQSKYGFFKRNSSGFYSSKDSTVVIFNDKKSNANNFLRACYHELSHVLLHIHVGENDIPAWFIEGVANYHEKMSYDKKKMTHRVNSYYIERVKTLIALKDIDLTEFVKWDYQKFSTESFTQESYGYAIGYCMVLFLMQQSEDKAFDIFRNLFNEDSTIEVFDEYYSGGFSKFEKDFMVRFGK